MKFIKNALTLLMATSIASSFFLTSCTPSGNNSDTGANNSSGSSTGTVEPEKTPDYLVKNGSSPYKIVLPDDADIRV